MTHGELIQRAERWLRNTMHCRVVLTELVAFTRSNETPDAIGWVNGRCILVECKTTRADFKADCKKPSRNWDRRDLPGGLQYPALGHWRFYLTLPGLLDGLELPAGWGWYVVDGRRVCHAAGENYRAYRPNGPPGKSDFDSERAMLVSALARAQN